MALNNHVLIYDFADQYFGPGESAGLVQALLCICGHLGGSASGYWLTIAELAGEQLGLMPPIIWQAGYSCKREHGSRAPWGLAWNTHKLLLFQTILKASQENGLDSGGMRNCSHFCNLPHWQSTLYNPPNLILTSTLEVKGEFLFSGEETETQSCWLVWVRQRMQLVGDGTHVVSTGSWLEMRSLDCTSELLNQNLHFNGIPRWFISKVWEVPQ